MGSATTKNYELAKTHGATAGHCGLWKIYSAVNKTTGERVSLWTMQKDELTKRSPVPITDRALAEQIFQIMRKDMITMKDINYVGIIKVLEVSILNDFLKRTFAINNIRIYVYNSVSYVYVDC